MADPTGTTGQEKAPLTPAQEKEQTKSQETGARKFTDDEAAALLKENMAMKAKQKKADDAEAKRVEDEAKAKGEHVKLYESEKQKNAKLETDLKKAMLSLAATQAGLTDLDYLKLIDESKITYGENFVPIGIAEAIEDLKTRKPALFATSGTTTIPKTPIPTKVGNTAGPGTYEEYLKMPVLDRKAFQEKQPEAYALLVKKAKGQ